MADRPRSFASYRVVVNRKMVHGGITERSLDERLDEKTRIQSSLEYPRSFSTIRFS